MKKMSPLHYKYKYSFQAYWDLTRTTTRTIQIQIQQKYDNIVQSLALHNGTKIVTNALRVCQHLENPEVPEDPEDPGPPDDSKAPEDLASPGPDPRNPEAAEKYDAP